MNRAKRNVFLGLALAAIAGAVSFLGYLRGPVGDEPVIRDSRIANTAPAALSAARVDPAAPAVTAPRPTAAVQRAVEGPLRPIDPDPEPPVPRDPPGPPREPTGGRRRSCCSTSRLLNGFALPVMYEPRYFRMKIILNADPRLPWGPPYPPEAVSGFASSIGVKDGTFPVYVWRNRYGGWKRILTIHVPAKSDGWVQEPVPDSLIQKGDLLVIENNTGFIRDLDPKSGAYNYPAGNIVDNGSGDPQLLPTFPFPVTEIRYTN